MRTHPIGRTLLLALGTIVFLSACSDPAASPRAESAPRETRSSPATSAPRIEFEEHEFEFGRVLLSDVDGKIEHAFRFRNTGGSVLTIDDVRASCGCTAGVALRKEIPPSEEGEVFVTFDPLGREGHQSKRITVTSNDPVHPRTYLSVTGDLRRPIWLEPRSLDLTDIGDRNSVPGLRAKLCWTRSEKVEVKGIDVSNPYAIRVESTPFDDGEFEGIDLEVTLTDVPALLGGKGRFNEKVYIRTDSKWQSELELPIRGSLRPAVKLQPESIVFGPISRSRGKLTRSSLMISADGDPLLRPTVESDLDFLDLEVRTIRENEEYKLLVTLDPELAPDGTFRGRVLIHPSSEGAPDRTMWVSGSIR